MKWIDCGLTWNKTFEYDRPDFPDVSELEREVFGTTQKELSSKFGSQWDDLLKGNFNALDSQSQRAKAQSMELEGVYEALLLYRSINTWRAKLDVMKDYEAECNRRHAQANAPTFVNQKLNVPGVEVEINGNRYLIGHVNDDAGGCGCCHTWDDQSIVTRYRVLVDYSKLGDE
jgi:hypothetical protein